MKREFERKTTSQFKFNSVTRYTLILVILILGIYSTCATRIPIVIPTVHWIPISDIPCYLGDLWCFEFEVDNPDESIKQGDFELGPGGPHSWASGRIHGEINGDFRLKINQIPLGWVTLINQPLKISIDLNFKVYYSEDDAWKDGYLKFCIEDRTEIDYALFELDAGFLDSPAFLAQKLLIIDGIKKAIKRTAEKNVLNYISAGQYFENPSLRPNIYCDTDQTWPQPSCECR